MAVTDFVPNVEVDEDTFRFDFPHGTHVTDRVLGVSYIIGGASPDGTVSPVRDISSAEKRQATNEAAEQTTSVTKPSSEEVVDDSEQLIDKDKEKEEFQIPIESVSAKDKILGIGTFLILGVGVLGALGLWFWYKRSART